MTLIAGGLAEGGNPSLTDDGAAIATRDYVDVTAIRVVAGMMVRRWESTAS
jgi:hypothetical protein